MDHIYPNSAFHTTLLDKVKERLFPTLSWQEFGNRIAHSQEPLRRYGIKKQAFLALKTWQKKDVHTDNIVFVVWLVFVGLHLPTCLLLRFRCQTAWKQLARGALGSLVSSTVMEGMYLAWHHFREQACYEGTGVVRDFFTPNSHTIPPSQALAPLIERGMLPKECLGACLEIDLFLEEAKAKVLRDQQTLDAQFRKEKISRDTYTDRWGNLREENLIPQLEEAYHRFRIAWLYAMYVKQHPKGNSLPNYDDFKSYSTSLAEGDSYHSRYQLDCREWLGE